MSLRDVLHEVQCATCKGSGKAASGVRCHKCNGTGKVAVVPGTQP